MEMVINRGETEGIDFSWFPSQCAMRETLDPLLESSHQLGEGLKNRYPKNYGQSDVNNGGEG